MTRPLPVALLLLLALGAKASVADELRPIDLKSVDKKLYESLREAHDYGRDFYNNDDAVSCYRVFQGGLITARGLMDHHPRLQKKISEGLNNADKLSTIGKKAFALHELIEEVRAELRGASPKVIVDVGPAPRVIDENKPEEKKPVEKKPEEKKPDEKKPEEKKPDEKKEPKLPEIKKEEKKPGKLDIVPEIKKEPKPEIKPNPKLMSRVREVETGIVGRLFYKNQGIEGATLSFVKLNGFLPTIYRTETGALGLYHLPEISQGRYLVALDPGTESEQKIPSRFRELTTTPLLFDIKGNGEKLDFLLQD